MTGFPLPLVHEVFDVIRRLLKPEGVLSYYEYVGLRRTSRLLSIGPSRERYRSVSAFLTGAIRNHQFAHRLVMKNIPPAHARHLRFDNGYSPQAEEPARGVVQGLSVSSRHSSLSRPVLNRLGS